MPLMMPLELLNNFRNGLGEHAGYLRLAVQTPPTMSFGLVDDFKRGFGEHAQPLADWLSQPHILAVVIAWAVTFTIICSLVLALGFGPIGIGFGTLAAAFQFAMYGGFTPAGGIFATLTSMAMLGTLMPAAAVTAAVLATAVAAVVWACGVGRP
ncbi:hypothetical protein F5X99DRAFT_365027 [Biscogniauxia marginata]|nr:hypothetical protein F5X99DRAFT_365027 [Biscogniauxia marginata]